MKLIIDIPNYNLDEVQNGSIASGEILKAVRAGTPYNPTGDLISRKALKRAACVKFYTTPYYKHILDLIDNAPTVEPICPYLSDDEVKQPCLEGPCKSPQGDWVVTAEDNDGVHRICCPFCSYEKGSNNTDTIIVTFTNFPKFCENCGADMRGGAE